MPYRSRLTPAKIRAEAEILAGRPQDLVQRAAVYVQLYRHSGGRFAFPLLAAHGALWGAGHFRRGLRIGRVLSFGTVARREKLARLDRFAWAFKDINRRVCIETYAAYHITNQFGVNAAIAAGIAPPLAQALGVCHDARRVGRAFSPSERRALFSAFFLWEQDNVVHRDVTRAVAALNWPLMEAISLRPPVWFSYLRAPLIFRDFSSKTERIDKGLKAYDVAAQRGWSAVEADIAKYGVMPAHYTAAPARHYADLLDSLGVAAV